MAAGKERKFLDNSSALSAEGECCSDELRVNGKWWLRKSRRSYLIGAEFTVEVAVEKCCYYFLP